MFLKILFFIFLWFEAFSQHNEIVGKDTPHNALNEFELMSYNVENLFDHLHDEGKNDWAYTPKNLKGKDQACRKISRKKYRLECFDSDWTKEKVDIKIAQIKKVITLNRKNIPDILVLSEVENDKIAGELASALGYKKYYMGNSPDERGIDVVIMIRDIDHFKFIAKKEIVLKDDAFKKRPTRNILEVEFLVLDKYPLTVFANHWPSLAGPNSLRVVAASRLSERIDEILKKNPKHYIIATGDFNTIPGPSPNPIDDILLKKGNLVDAYSFRDEKSMPPASYYFSRDDTWNKLDRIFISKNLLPVEDKDKSEGIKALPKSFEIYAPDFIKNKKGHPKKYNKNAKKEKSAGYSDHFPLIMRFHLK